MTNILFVIVLYNQRLETCNTYHTLLSRIHGANVFIFDNSPIKQHDAHEFACDNIHYLSETSNPGLSYAYNQAAKYAKTNNFKWLLLLDQDTYFPPLIVEDYLLSAKKHPLIKLIVPRVVRSNNLSMSPILNRFFFNCTPVDICSTVLKSNKYSAINSGICINVSAFLEVGGYNEKVTLDLSDMCFFERYSQKYNDFYVMSSICIQEFSNDIQNFDKKMIRYNIFCECVKNYAKDGMRNKLSYDIFVIKRAISLCLRNFNIKPIFIMLDKYFNMPFFR